MARGGAANPLNLLPLLDHCGLGLQRRRLRPAAFDPKRTRAKSRRLDTTSQDQALRRDARLSRFSISSCHCTMDSKFRIVAACDAEQLMDHDFCLAALDGHPPKSAGNDAVRHP